MVLRSIFGKGYQDYRADDWHGDDYTGEALNEYHQGWGCARRGSVLGEGRYAKQEGFERSDCPHKGENMREWLMGWDME